MKRRKNLAESSLNNVFLVTNGTPIEPKAFSYQKHDVRYSEHSLSKYLPRQQPGFKQFRRRGFWEP